jgi:hydroxyacylglutathione hydrolase
MKIKIFTVNPFQMNCYLYYDEAGGEGIIIDPAAYEKHEEEEIKSFVTDNRINVNYILNTHGHIDHILGNRFAKEAFRCPVLIHRDDLFLIEDAKPHGLLFGINIDNVPAPDDFITEDLIIKINNTEIGFIHTPGHTPGGVCIVDHSNKIIFSGDTIFLESIGRTDLPGGNLDILIDSIKNKLFAKCGDDYALYPGHMEETTIGQEKKYNSFLR